MAQTLTESLTLTQPPIAVCLTNSVPAGVDKWSGHSPAGCRFWQEAASRLGELLTRFPEDGPAQVFLERVLEFMQNAPEPDWDGVYVMTHK